MWSTRSNYFWLGSGANFAQQTTIELRNMEIWFLEDKKYDFVLEIGYHTNFFLKKRKNKKIKKILQAVECIHLPPTMLYPKMKHMMKICSKLMDRNSCLCSPPVWPVFYSHSYHSPVHHLKTIALLAVRTTSYIVFQSFRVWDPVPLLFPKLTMQLFYTVEVEQCFFSLFYTILPFCAQIIKHLVVHIYPHTKLMNHPGSNSTSSLVSSGDEL